MSGETTRPDAAPPGSGSRTLLPTLRERRVYLLAIVLQVAVVIGLLLSPISSARFWAHDDLANQSLPMRHQYAQALSATGEPGSFVARLFWNPHLFLGFDAHGEGQVGMLHPGHLVLYSTLPLATAFLLETVTPHLFLWVGLLLLCRRCGCTRTAAAYAATLVAFVGSALYRFPHVNLVAVLAHAPWLAWITLSWLDARTPGRRALCFAALTLLTASQVLLGHPQAVVLAGSFELAFLIFGLLDARGRDSRPGGAWRDSSASASWRVGLAGWLGAHLLGVLLGAPQLLPTLQSLASSTRTETDLAFRLAGSLHPVNFGTWVSPFALSDGSYGYNRWEIAAYAGAATPILLIVLVLARGLLPPRQRILVAICGALAVVATWLALGRWGGLYPLATRLPLFDVFRLPARWMLVTHLALAVPIGLAFDLLRRPDDVRSHGSSALGWPLARWIALPALLSVATLIGVAILRLGIDADAPRPRLLDALVSRDWASTFLSPLPAVAAGTLVIVASTLAVGAIVSARPPLRRLGLWALLLLLGLDLATQGLAFVLRQPAMSVADIAPRTWAPPGEPEVGRLAGPPEARFLLTRLSLRDWSSTRGYGGLMPERRLPQDHPSALRLQGVAWGLEGEIDDLTGVRESPVGAAPTSEGRPTWRRMPDPLERARFVPAWSSASAGIDLEAALDQLEVGTAVWLDSVPADWPAASPADTHRAEDAPVRVEIVETAPGHFALELEDPVRQRGWLVVSEGWHDDWTARATGHGGIAASPVHRAWGDLIAVPLEPGTTRVELDFGATAFRRGMVPAGLAAIATLAVVLVLPGRAWRDSLESL